jgi:hypothetical protein
MSSTFQPNAGAPSSGRLAYQRAADGVVAAYIHEMSRSPRPAADAAAAPARARAAAGARGAGGYRFRPAGRRRSHASFVPRPLPVNASCPGA